MNLEGEDELLLEDLLTKGDIMNLVDGYDNPKVG